MAKVAVYNQEGKKTEDIELNDAIFGVKGRSVVHQVYTALKANLRQPWAHTKDRSDVRGGGRKPWRQKGTGRARHGSSRSPIWTGGGVTFGPTKARNYKQKINKKMNAKAVKVCLSDKVKDEKFIVLDALESDGKTKQIAALRSKLPGAGKSTLLLFAGNNDKLRLATRNLPKVDLQRTIDVNVTDLLDHQYVIATKSDIEILEKRLG